MPLLLHALACCSECVQPRRNIPTRMGFVLRVRPSAVALRSDGRLGLMNLLVVSPIVSESWTFNHDSGMWISSGYFRSIVEPSDALVCPTCSKGCGGVLRVSRRRCGGVEREAPTGTRLSSTRFVKCTCGLAQLRIGGSGSSAALACLMRSISLVASRGPATVCFM